MSALHKAGWDTRLRTLMAGLLFAVAGVASASPQFLIVTGQGAVDAPREQFNCGNGCLWKFDADGNSLGRFDDGEGNLDEPSALQWGPDGNVYALTGNNRVAVFDGKTGHYIGDFISAGAYGLYEAKDIAFGPDGNLYVSANQDTCNTTTGEGGHVMVFNGQTGALMGDAVPNLSGTNGSGPYRLSEAMALAFDPIDGSLYVGNDPRCLFNEESGRLTKGPAFPGSSPAAVDNILKFQVRVASNGAVSPPKYRGSAMTGYLQDPNQMRFGPGGFLYVAWEDDTTISNYCYAGAVSRINRNLVSSELVPSSRSALLGLCEAQGLGFMGDRMFVGSGDTAEVFVFDAGSGAFIRKFPVNEEPKAILVSPKQ